MKQISAIFGCSGQRLTPDEKAFFRDCMPWGFILFARNIESKDQIRALIGDFKEALGCDNIPVLVDQEGGCVSRLKEPNWRHPPAPTVFPKIFSSDPKTALRAAFLNYRLIAYDLKTLGINIDCAPMLDIASEGSHDIIVDRALGNDAETVCAIGRAIADGLLHGGVAPVIKHGPGHGRAIVDSHISLPRVTASHKSLSQTDFVPFKAFNKEAMLMTAHIIYEAIDDEFPATLSSLIIEGVLRKECGFDGLIMTDDLNMNALTGTLKERSRASLAAGCDMLLHCNGELKDMLQVAESSITLDGDALRRANVAAGVAFCKAQDFDASEALTQFESILGI